MQGNCLPGYIELVSNRLYIDRFFCNHSNNCPSRRVCYGLKNISSCFHNMQVFTCQFKGKHLLAQLFSHFYLKSYKCTIRSEERRVGKECRSRWWTSDYKVK